MVESGVDMCSEWTYEGRVSAEKQVACDGNSTRYQGSIHDGVWTEWAMISSNWVVPQENGSCPCEMQGQGLF